MWSITMYFSYYRIEKSYLKQKKRNYKIIKKFLNINIFGKNRVDMTQ